MQEPYTYETLYRDLSAQPDLITCMGDAVHRGMFAEKGTWRRAICDHVTYTYVPAFGECKSLYMYSVLWATYLHPVSDAELDAAITANLLDLGKEVRVASSWAVREYSWITPYVFSEVRAPNSLRVCTSVLGAGPLQRLLSDKVGVELEL